MKKILPQLIFICCILISIAAFGSNKATTDIPNLSNSNIKKATVDVRPKYRIGFDAPQITHRQLLLTIDENTTDGVDWGYDGEIPQVLADDMYWLISGNKYVIQATDAISVGKEISLGVITTNGGLVTIKIDAIDNPIEGLIVALKDKELNEVYNLEEGDYQITLPAGEYHNRFFITFLSVDTSEDTTTGAADETYEDNSEESNTETTDETSEDALDDDTASEDNSEESNTDTTDDSNTDTADDTEGGEAAGNNSVFNRKAKLVIYVNNGQGILNIKNKEALTIKNVVLLNKIGQQIKVWKQGLNSENIQLDVHVRKGIYYVVVKTNKGRVLKRVMIRNS